MVGNYLLHVIVIKRSFQIVKRLGARADVINCRASNQSLVVLADSAFVSTDNGDTWQAWASPGNHEFGLIAQDPVTLRTFTWERMEHESQVIELAFTAHETVR